ncbi:MAG: dynamin family protein [Lachnospiraceae bacterium]|nr:dynamin family protein [Lachnospiraceae bacterium]
MNMANNLLKRIIMTDVNPDLQSDLNKIEKIITRKLPDTLEKNAPPNFAELYFDFRQEYERFKEFILFDKLIGKNIVALGGGFSSGKSSFLNSILGEDILPSDITPSTSVPAYLIHDEQVTVYGINTFESKINMQSEEVSLIAHGFGQDDEDGMEVTLGHLLRSLFISSPNQPFSHLALLDTPGYSKAETNNYSAKTDEKIARTQLNSANFILWFVSADNGTITNSDIEFLRSLNQAIPKLVIVNKADKLPPDELDEVVEKIRDILKTKGINFADVLTYSSEEPEYYDRDKILEYTGKWNNAVTQSRFAYNFKVLFTKCKEYYENQILERRKYISRINKSSAYSDHEFVLTFLDELRKTTVDEISSFKETENILSEISLSFFEEISNISKKVGIDMPEPTEIDLIDDKMED